MNGFLLHLCIGRCAKPEPSDGQARKLSVAGGDLLFAGPNAVLVERSEARIILRHGEQLCSAERSDINWLHQSPNGKWSGARGTLVRVIADPIEIIVATDLLSSFPVYYWKAANQQQVVIGSSLTDVQRRAKAGIDTLGAYQYLTKGYTYNDRTVVDGIRQLRAGEVLRVRRLAAGLDISTTTYTTLWTQAEASVKAKDILDEVAAIWLSEANKLQNSLLMMSGGWDSRTILAGILAADSPGTVVAYSHGQIRSREVRLAARASRMAGVAHVSRSIHPASFTPDAAARIINASDTFLFPHWWDAGEYASHYDKQCITAGVYGELLGGHSSVPFLAARREGHRALLRYIFGRLDAANSSPAQTRNRVVTLLDEERHISLWCMSGAWNSSLLDWAKEAVQADLEDVVDRYVRLGISGVEQLVEAFVVDHRNRQYTNAQVRTATHKVGTVNPFTNPRLLELLAAVPLTEKIHNDFNRRLLRIIAPDLLKLPMAATLVAANRPVLLQELSRLARKGIEQASPRIARLSKGRIHPTKLSWVDFAPVTETNVLHDLIDSLRLPIWNQSRMHKAVGAVNVSAHSLFDMLAKCKTFDFQLSGD